jgi:divalent metal cation (Fe/Co/Zn/Cd) transporter
VTVLDRLSTRHLPVETSERRREALARRVRWLVAATISYNAIEAIVALVAGGVASSTALVGFGLDSLIEVSSATAVAWQFSACNPAQRDAREHRTLRVIAVSFFALAAYVTVQSLRSLLGAGTAEHSPAGIALTALSVVVMPALSYAQRRTGRRLGSATAVADSKQTLLCTWLSIAVLAGLLANSTLGWSWADPIAALVVAALAVNEGRNAWRGNACCATPPAHGANDTESACTCDTNCDCR